MNTDAIHSAMVTMGPIALLDALGVSTKPFRRSGSQYRGPCPIHNGSTPSFVIGERDGRIQWVCHSSCGGVGGDGISLVANVRGIDVRANFQAVLSEVNSLLGGTFEQRPREEKPISEEETRRAYAMAHAESMRSDVLSEMLRLSPLDGEGLRYLTEERCLDPNVCVSAGVGFVRDPSWVCYELLRMFGPDVLDALGIVYHGQTLAFVRHRLLVPIVREGVPVYVQGRALGPVSKSHERFRSCRGNVPCLLGVDSLKSDRPVILTEGLVDTLTATQLWGSTHAVVGILGAGGLRHELAMPLRGKHVSLALDRDDAGTKGTENAIKILSRLGCELRRVNVPPPAKDLNEWWQIERAA